MVISKIIFLFGFNPVRSSSSFAYILLSVKISKTVSIGDVYEIISASTGQKILDFIYSRTILGAKIKDMLSVESINAVEIPRNRC